VFIRVYLWLIPLIIIHMAKAVILLSGGLDSATTLAVARRDGFACHCLSIDYGQRHKVELEFAAVQAKLQHAVEHRVVRVDLRAIGGSALTDDITVPKDVTATGIPITYVPARNTVMLSVLLGYAEVTGAFDLFIGANAVDYSGYPDCRPEYLRAFEAMANLATKAAVEGQGQYRVQSPLVQMTKAEIIRLGTSLGVDYSQTVSCYDPGASGVACGHCDSCVIRKRGFVEAGVADPTRYA
jgi:7-cyano-7-deazaguanine synthase